MAAHSAKTSDVPRHGGDLGHATRLHGRPADGWLDLSTGINPHPFPAPPVAPSAFTRLPDPGDLDRLQVAARSAYDVPDKAALLAVPGTELALRLLPTVCPDGRVAILAPAYSTHLAAFAAFGRPVVAVADIENIPPDTAFVLLGNPGNPDGRRFEVGRLSELAARLEQRGGGLVVDEAYADLVPDLSLVPHLASVRAIVLRSFGKFYGLPGLRLGFVAGPRDLIDLLAERIGAWPVNAAALAIGATALADTRWRSAMRSLLAADALEMRKAVAAHGLDIAGATDLFLLVHHPKARALHQALARRGIWTRIFAEGPEHLRLGLAPPGPALTRLDVALAESLREI